MSCQACVRMVFTAGACGSGSLERDGRPNYQRPKVNSPSSFRGAQGARGMFRWPTCLGGMFFRDETLKELIKTALANNYDVAIAATRVEQARQILAQERSQ